MKGNPGRPRVNKTHRGPKTMHNNPKHEFQMSAVKERCICGELKEHRVHFKLTTKKPKPLTTVQVGISPDCPWALELVERCLGWKIDSRVDDCVWQVATPKPWPVNVNFECTLSADRLALPAGAPAEGLEVEVNLEWP